MNRAKLKFVTNQAKKQPLYRVFATLESRLNKNGTIRSKPMCPFVHDARAVFAGELGTPDLGDREMPEVEDGVQDDDGPTSVLVMHESIGKNIFSHAVPHKGNQHVGSEFAIQGVASDIESLGYRRIIVRGTQEPALLAFLRRVRRHVQRLQQWGSLKATAPLNEQCRP